MVAWSFDRSASNCSECHITALPRQIAALNYHNIYSHLFNKRGGWNKRGGGAKVAKSLNVEAGINVEGGIF